MTQTMDCIVLIKQFGSTLYANICNGQTMTVGWGLFEWMEGIFLAFGCLILLVALAGLLYTVVASFFWSRKNRFPKAPGMQE